MPNYCQDISLLIILSGNKLAAVVYPSHTISGSQTTSATFLTIRI